MLSPTIFSDAIALSLTTESSLGRINSKGFNKCEALCASPRYFTNYPSCSAKFIISSGLLSILSINSVSIGISSSMHRSGPN
jgi:hypothetical protein